MRGFAKNSVLVLFSMFLAVLIAESVGQIFFKPPPRFITGFRLSASGYYMENALTGWSPRPNINGEHNQEGSFETTFSTNSLGLRDDESAAGPRSRPIRVVALGDSFTWGFGVNDHEIYTAVIEEIAPDVEVVNLGVTAFGLRQEIAYFDAFGRSMQPDIVLLALVMNDITDPLRMRPGEPIAEWMDRVGMRPREDEAPTEPTLSEPEPWSISRIKPWLGDNSVLYRALTDVINTNRVLVSLLVSLGLKGEPAGFEGLDSNLRPFLATDEGNIRESVERTKQELIELRDKVHEIDARLLVAVVPALQSVDRRARLNSIAYTQYFENQFDLDKPYRWLAEFGNDEGIAIVNVVDVIRASHEAGTFAYLPNDMHFNPAGHRLFAEQIVEFLKNQRWIE